MKPCPHPDKRAHATEAAALDHRNWLRFQQKGSPDLAVYHCRCGAWHVGHSRTRLNNRIRKVLGKKRMTNRKVGVWH